MADFDPVPASPTVPEVIWSQSQLYQGPGAVGNGDGDLPVSQQTQPGLAVETPFEIPGLPGGIVNYINNSTSFYDASLLIIPTGANQLGLPAVGSPVVTPITQQISIFSQLLGSGDFQIWTTQPSQGSQSLLLEGTINSSVITGMLNSTSGSLVSSDVTYTSGAILTAAEGFPPTVQPITGQLSWSFLDATPQFQQDSSGPSPILAPFTANATGQFSALVPEPGALMILLSGVPIAFFACRRWLSGRGHPPTGSQEVV